jgi:hypothetical protein
MLRLGSLAALLFASACTLEYAPQASGTQTTPSTGSGLTDDAASGACEDRAIDVEALLASYCAGCHGNGNTVAGFRDVLQHERLIASGKIVPGRPAESQLYVFVETGFMPRTDRKPSTGEIAVLRAWIECGAPAW